MPHGRPDWYDITPMIQVHSSEDVNELAARLNSPNVYDRRGNVIYQTDWSNGDSDWYVTPGGGASYSIDYEYSRIGGVTLKCYLTAAAADTVTVTKGMSIPYSESIGAELCWSMSGTPGYIDWSIIVARTPTKLTGTIRYNYTSQVLSYKASDGSFVQISDTVDLRLGPRYFSFLKLCIDKSTGKYLRCLVNDYPFSLSEYELYPSAFASTPYIEVKMIAYSSGVALSGIYVDSVIVTINEI